MKYIYLLSLTFLLPAQVYASEKPVAQVITQEVQKIRLGRQIRVNAVVQSRGDLILSAKIEGELLWVLEPGALVEANGSVAKVDDTFLQIEIKEQELLAERANIDVKYLQGEVGRLRQLEKSNMASQTQMAETASRRDLAKNNYKVALIRLSRLKEQLKRSEIISPVAGVVVVRFRQGGEFTRRGEGVVRVVDPLALEVRATVPLIYISRLEVGSTLDLKVGSHKLQGKLRSMIVAGDETSQTFDVYVDVTNPSTAIVDGQFAEVSIPLSDSEKSLLVPRDALVLRGDGNYVFRINENNEAKRISVVLGEGRGDLVTVNGNLKAGDKVAVRGVERLTDGQLVSQVNASQDKSSQGT